MDDDENFFLDKNVLEDDWFIVYVPLGSCAHTRRDKEYTNFEFGCTDDIVLEEKAQSEVFREFFPSQFTDLPPATPFDYPTEPPTTAYNTSFAVDFGLGILGTQSQFDTHNTQLQLGTHVGTQAQVRAPPPPVTVKNEQLPLKPQIPPSAWAVNNALPLPDDLIDSPVLQDSKRGKKRKPNTVIAPSTTTVTPIASEQLDINDLMEPFIHNDVPTYHSVISQALKLLEQQHQELQAIYTLQASVIGSNLRDDIQAISQLVGAQQTLRTKISEEGRILRDLRCSQILEVHDQHQMLEILDALNVQSQQIEVLIEELYAWQNNVPNPRCFARLVIKEQPFPYIYVRSTPGRAAIGAKTQQREINMVGDIDINVKVGQKKSSTMYTDIRTAPMQIKDNKICADIILSFTTGTGMSVGALELRVPIQFSCLAAGNIYTATDQLSTLSRSFIILTNESQYAEALAVLFNSDVVSSSASSLTPWPLVANGIHHYFLLATRQNYSTPARPLLASDLEHLRQQWLEEVLEMVWISIKEPAVPKALAEALGEKVGCICTDIDRLRLIYGFAKKAITDDLVLPRDYGTFVLRFSESSPGCIAVCYKVADTAKPVKNYLVKPEDVKGKTLPEFLLSRHELTSIIQFVSADSLDDKIPVVRSFEKFVALPQSRIKQPPATATVVGGYETALF